MTNAYLDEQDFNPSPQDRAAALFFLACFLASMAILGYSCWRLTRKAVAAVAPAGLSRQDKQGMIDALVMGARAANARAALVLERMAFRQAQPKAPKRKAKKVLAAAGGSSVFIQIKRDLAGATTCREATSTEDILKAAFQPCSFGPGPKK